MMNDYDAKQSWNIPIDSKFPLDNFGKDPERFKKDVKTKIDDIAHKYISQKDNIKEAIMFLPSENVYYELLASYQEL
jgi:DNA recombination protein RmuC